MMLRAAVVAHVGMIVLAVMIAMMISAAFVACSDTFCSCSWFALKFESHCQAIGLDALYADVVHLAP